MPTQPEHVIEILAAFDDADSHDSVWWRTDGKYAPITLLVNCNDLFYWATADAEEITINNLPVYRQAVADIRAIGGMECSAAELFCCRVRGMRPQGPFYRELDGAEKALFDACGPPREKE